MRRGASPYPPPFSAAGPVRGWKGGGGRKREEEGEGEANDADPKPENRHAVTGLVLLLDLLARDRTEDDGEQAAQAPYPEDAEDHRRDGKSVGAVLRRCRVVVVRL